MKIFFTKHHPIFHKKFLLLLKFLISDFSECFLLVALTSTFNCRASLERFVPFYQKGNAWKKNTFAIQAKGIVQNDFGGPAVLSR